MATLFPNKAKYEVIECGKVRYMCVTTTRNTEDMINILYNRFGRRLSWWHIRKTVNGQSEVVMSFNVPRYRKMVVDGDGRLYANSNVFANSIGYSASTVRRWLRENRTERVRYAD